MTFRLTVAEVFRRHAKEFLESFSTRLLHYQKKAFRALSVCRTAALGGRILECQVCGTKVFHYNSCRVRGCPQCEGSKEGKWLLARESELLPTKYFHVVFTLPHALNDLILHNQKECFSIFFRSVSKAMLTVGRNRLNGKLGFFCILHTWGQKLDLHYHIHCVVPGGVVTDNGTWVPTSKNKLYFLPEKVLSKVFQGIFLRALRNAVKANKVCPGNCNLESLITQASQKPWVIHTAPPFGSALCVLKYLSRYTRKVACSNSRLVGLSNGILSFSWKDYAKGAIRKICSLSAVEFIRRFLMHIPPPGFVRIRYYGFMAGKNRKERLNALRETIFGLLPNLIIPTTDNSDNSFNPGKCPCCGSNALFVISEIAPALIVDSS